MAYEIKTAKPDSPGLAVSNFQNFCKSIRGFFFLEKWLRGEIKGCLKGWRSYLIYAVALKVMSYIIIMSRSALPDKKTPIVFCISLLMITAFSLISM